MAPAIVLPLWYIPSDTVIKEVRRVRGEERGRTRKRWSHQNAVCS